MQQLAVVGGFLQQPLMAVLGVLAGAGAAKSGHGAWVAGGMVMLVLTLIATRNLAARIRQVTRRPFKR
jgi:hypothetical protein